MSDLLQKPWYFDFRREMEAIGCKFPDYVSLIGDEDIKVPIDKQKEASTG